MRDLGSKQCWIKAAVRDVLSSEQRRREELQGPYPPLVLGQRHNRPVHGPLSLFWMVLFTQKAENTLAAAAAVSSAVGVDVAGLVPPSHNPPLSWLPSKFGHWLFEESSCYEAM